MPLKNFSLSNQLSKITSSKDSKRSRSQTPELGSISGRFSSDSSVEYKLDDEPDLNIDELIKASKVTLYNFWKQHVLGLERIKKRQFVQYFISLLYKIKFYVTLNLQCTNF